MYDDRAVRNNLAQVTAQPCPMPDTAPDRAAALTRAMHAPVWRCMPEVLLWHQP